MGQDLTGPVIASKGNHLLIYVAPDSLDFYWPFARDFILAAEAFRNVLSEEDIFWRIFSGVYKLFIVSTPEQALAALTVEVVNDADGPFARIEHIGGKAAAVAAFEEELTLCAKAYGAAKVRLSGRKGWLRKLKEYNFERVGMYMEKEIAQ